MRRFLASTHRLGAIFGIEVRAMFLLYVFLGVLFLTRALAEGPSARLFWLAAVIVIYAISVLAHELGHALTAQQAGLRVRSIILHPLGGVACLQGRLAEPAAEISIALAGPAVSIIIAGACWVGCRLYDMPLSQALSFHEHAPFPALFASGFFINLILALFNLLPVFPLDGGRAFATWAEMRWGAQAFAFRRQAAFISVYLLVGIGLWCWLYRDAYFGVYFLILAYFLHHLGQQEIAEREHGGGVEPWRSAVEDARQDAGHGEGAAQEGWWQRWQRRLRQGKARTEAEARDAEERQVDALLAKIKEGGLESLTDTERNWLDEVSQRRRAEKNKAT